MTINRKTTGTSVSIPVGLASGAIVSAGMTLGGALLTAQLLERQILGWDNSGYAVLLILLLSAWAGAAVTIQRVKRQRMLMSVGAGAVYLLMLLGTTALFFGGQYSGVGETALLIFSGSLLAHFSGFRGKPRRKAWKMRRHHG